MRVAVIGTGYVGLVSGACLADFGHQVTCIDKDAGRIAALCRGEMPIYEPGLNDIVAANTRAGRLHFATELTGAVASADAVFIAVGTPSRRGDGFRVSYDVTSIIDPASPEVTQRLRETSFPSAEIHNLVRAVAPPYPGARTTLDGRQVRILRTRVLEATAAATNAPSLHIERGRVVASCGGGGKLLILALEVEGALVAADALSAWTAPTGLLLLR